MQIIFALLDDRIDLETRDHLSIFVGLLECLVLLLEFLVDDELVADLGLEVGIFLQKCIVNTGTSCHAT